MSRGAREAARIRKIIASDQLGGVVRFRACFCSPGFNGLGVLDALGPYALELLEAMFGKLELVDCRHDGHGGPEAEALIGLRAGEVSGTLLVTRLRDLGDKLDISGSRGSIRYALARPKYPAGAPMFDRPAFAAESLRATALPLRHPWERASPRAFADLAGKRVLVTGATGFIGARVVERLAQSGARVTAGVRAADKAARIARFGAVDLAVMRADTDLAALASGHDAVINLAHDFLAGPQSNYRLAVALADACEAARVPVLVQASSIAVYDDWPGATLDEFSPSDEPGHPYKEAKRAIERDLLARRGAGRPRVAILQPTLVYGAFSRFWTDGFADRFTMGDVAVPDEGLCDGVHVDDLADAILAAISRSQASGRYIVSGPEAFAWRELLKSFSSACSGWGALRIEPSLPPPAPAERAPPSLASRVKARVTGAIATIARKHLGEDRLRRARALLLKARARGKRPLYRPAAENPRLFANRAAVSTTRMRRDLVEPVIGVGEGAKLTRDYLAWRYCPQDDLQGTH